MEKTPPFSIHRSCARYRDSLKDAILLMKYRGYRTLGKDLARFASEALKKEELLWQGVDALVPVPLHPRRLRERGFNQAQVLSLEIGRLKGIPVEAGVLRKIRNVPPQTLLQQNERIQNVRGVYEIGRRAHIAGRIYLLVDDVFTTGSTIGECAAVLKKAGAREVRAVSIAQA
jgi:competence protein ComFC